MKRPASARVGRTPRQTERSAPPFGAGRRVDGDLAASLGAGGLTALRSGVLQRWIAVVALIGAVSFAVTFLTTLDGTAEGRIFGYGFFPSIVAMIVWSIATSLTAYRAAGVATEQTSALQVDS